ncbi:glycosyltransferase 87 family protein [Candidatus Pelagibacter sp.]|nr:glycosyltransferase 87 family protein [Candidatus Pelagibacter sp.]
MSKNLTRSFKFILIILSILSLGRGIFNAYLHSHDFQYSPAVMAWSGINHYQYVLNGGREMANDILMLSQNGEYGQGLFILLYPFTLLSWDFAKFTMMIINVFLSIFLPIFLSKKFNLSREKTFLLLTLFLISTPCRNVIGNGQISFIMLFFLSFPFFYKQITHIILSGVVYLKYNIGYLLFLYFLSKKEIKNTLYSSIIFIFGWLIYCFITNSNLLTNLIEPLKVTFYIKTTSELIYGLSFLKFILNDNSYLNFLILSSSVVFSFLFLLKIKDANCNLIKLSLFCLIILIFSPHRMYDYILLLPLLAFSLKHFERYSISKINMLFIFYIFFGLRTIKEFNIDIDNNIIIAFINIFVFLFLFISNYFFFKKKIFK